MVCLTAYCSCCISACGGSWNSLVQLQPSVTCLRLLNCFRQHCLQQSSQSVFCQSLFQHLVLLLRLLSCCWGTSFLCCVCAGGGPWSSLVQLPSSVTRSFSLSTGGGISNCLDRCLSNYFVALSCFPWCLSCSDFILCSEEFSNKVKQSVNSFLAP